MHKYYEMMEANFSCERENELTPLRLTLLKNGLVTPRRIDGSAEELLEVISLKSASCIV